MIERQKKLRVAATAALVAGVLGLAGCGGGGGGNDGGIVNIGNAGGGVGVSGGTIPASALQDSGGFIQYVKQVVSRNLDTSEPIDLNNAVAPTSNTTEAVTVDL